VAGVKGRSGRRGYRHERQTQGLWNRSVALVLEYLDRLDVSLKDKVFVAVKLIEKLAPPPVAAVSSVLMHKPTFVFQTGEVRQLLTAETLAAAPTLMAAQPDEETPANGH